MIVVGVPAQKVDKFLAPAFTLEHIKERLEYWRTEWLRVREDPAASPLDLIEVEGAMNRWLDEYSDLRGR